MPRALLSVSDKTGLLKLAQHLAKRGFELVATGGTARMLTAGGLAVTSVLFGLLHPISFTYIVIAGLLGLYLGVVWIVNGNLLAVMVTHALYDFAVLGYLIRVQHRDDAEPDSN